MRRQLLLLLALVCMAGSAAHAATVTYFSGFSGSAEASPNASAGSGSLSLAYDEDANTLKVMLDFSGLTGTTTAAHIHCCSGPGVNSAVAVALDGFATGVTAGTYNVLFDLSDPGVYAASFLSASGGTAAAAEMALATALASGQTYVNIHTTAFPGGEIRANPVAMRVPEPGAIALIAIGALALYLTHRDRA
ncbi:CHRD domain-containing protein [Cognatazoarcus halotolerans]|uniref:CHRD domain-containing protein n=1 Tax=Cognatazoarcus halotolerans TaxID=2686016 RepID=UPI00135C1E11|nr:CHRD domain-containing protein [Cognatazoarcus halotolerans]MCB1901155.1 CHRD domain-containing protein [Rhodocyclaceae bacterium]MCP5310394.1 CHRD domain-containing protein [Zoogloeaceae bacterium]